MQYVLSAVRLAYDDKVILNTTPIQNWLNRLAQGLFNHETPDGYSLLSASWNGPGQMMVRSAVPLTMAGRVWAAPATDARLLVVFLRGAHDAANVVVPVGSDFYYGSRPNLTIAKPDSGNPNAALMFDSDWGLQPALRDSIFPLWAKRKIAFVPFAGTGDDLTRSHF